MDRRNPLLGSPPSMAKKALGTRAASPVMAQKKVSAAAVEAVESKAQKKGKPSKVVQRARWMKETAETAKKPVTAMAGAPAVAQKKVSASEGKAAESKPQKRKPSKVVQRARWMKEAAEAKEAKDDSDAKEASEGGQKRRKTRKRKHRTTKRRKHRKTKKRRYRRSRR